MFTTCSILGMKLMYIPIQVRLNIQLRPILQVLLTIPIMRIELAHLKVMYFDQEILRARVKYNLVSH